MTKLAVILMTVGVSFIPADSPATPKPNPLCYSNQAYHDTHEQDCFFTHITGGGKNGNTGLGGLLHHLGL